MEETFVINNGSCHITKKSCNRNSQHMLPVMDWMSDIPKTGQESDLVEVQFKNTRKAYYHNTLNLPIEKGTVVILEANPGYDMGEVTLTGKLVEVQMKKSHINLERYEIRNILRIATEEDKTRAAEAHAKEQDTMIKSRQLAKSLGLEMKIGDVEYQGDGTKAIFYYIADGRVDFRQLIKVYAESFRVRIEMKQIGARQEAGRIGGTGPCGRELCCSTWMTQFSSVGTNAARIQNIALNPQKLAGQCAKLKCCLNYETPIYEEAVKKMPSRHVPLETKDATYYLFSTDPLKGEVTYSTDAHHPTNLLTITAKRAKEIIDMNRRGEKPLALGGVQSTIEIVEIDYQNVVGQDDLTRFDKKKRDIQRNNRRKNKPGKNNK
ncbi:MAG: regulatory iron-sulfur-containing complex subunit RicT [Paludibacteraceae bacterium]|nr:regulatory iron-sulfur-containing complex subunit RicT [Paludibacteraceae bacterium]